MIHVRHLGRFAAQQGALGTREKELILQILSLDRRNARDVLRPRAQMVALPDLLKVLEYPRRQHVTTHDREVGRRDRRFRLFDDAMYPADLRRSTLGLDDAVLVGV